MRGRVISVLLFLSLIVSSTVHAQCNLTFRDTSPFRASMFDVTVDGNDLWVATGYGVQLLDRGVDPPALIAERALPGVTRVVRVVPNGVVYAASGSRIWVLRKNGRAIQTVRFVDAGATINDLAFTSHLWAATTNGIVQFDIFDTANPTRTNITVTATNTNVQSIAINQNSLYAADGDSSVEIFNIAVASLPQKTGTLESLPRSISVQTTPGRVLVSDGQNTDIFVGTTRAARVPFGATSLALITSNESFVAGTERDVRAIDFGVAASPVELFEASLAPTGGTQNRVFAMAAVPGRLYVAAGDMGLVTYDTSAFAAPYVLRSYATGATSSAIVSGTNAWVTGASGGINELSISANNFLTQTKSWNSGTPSILHDADGAPARLLTASGRTATIWTTGTTPAQSYTATFPQPIRSAVLRNDTIYAALADATLWSVNINTDATPRPIASSRVALLARAGNAIAVIGEPQDDGNSIIRYYSSGDLASVPTRSITIAGAATGNATMTASQLAVFTFRGISIVDFATGNVTVLPGSDAHIVKELRFAGTKLLALTDRALHVWDPATRRLVRELALPADAVAMHASGNFAVVATIDGVISVNYESAQRLPSAFPIRNANRYYTKVVAGESRVYLFGSHGIDIFNTTIGDRPRRSGGISASGIIDLAASRDRLFTLASNGTVSAHARDGNLLAQTTLNEGADAQPLAIFTANGAVWVAYSTGCLSGGCVKKTLVLDPSTLAVTATLTGGAVDVVTTDTRAYALFDLPNEVRVLDVADALHPVQITSRALDAKFNTVAHGGGAVTVAGNDVLTFDETTLTPREPLIATDRNVERLRIDGTCAIATGRTFDTELHRLGSPLVTAVELPGPVRSMAVQPGRVFFLTDYSLDVASVAPGPPPSRRRATR